MTQPVRNADLEDNVQSVKLAIPLIQLLNNAFFVMVVFHVMLQTQLNAQDVSSLKFSTELARHVLMLIVQLKDVFNAIWTQPVKFVKLDIH